MIQVQFNLTTNRYIFQNSLDFEEFGTLEGM